tara:strand:+ start:263 stop:457 length:195 start_codon:yes stop_codon:yes gene_type:complete
MKSKKDLKIIIPKVDIDSLHYSIFKYETIPMMKKQYKNKTNDELHIIYNKLWIIERNKNPVYKI